MEPILAPGLSVDWLNGWLAAVGVTVLLPDVRLSWTEDATPVAQFHGANDFFACLLDALPTKERYERFPSAGPVHRIDAAHFEKLARRARDLRDPLLSSLVTDLARGFDSGLPRGEFNPSVPKEASEFIFARYLRCRRAVTAPSQVKDALSGSGIRVEANGLGFDYRRLHPATYPGAPGKYVDPVIECLCFAALPLFPVRGNGSRYSRTRGWLLRKTSSQPSFIWASWSTALDRWAIDGLLDVVHRAPDEEGTLRRLGVTSLFESVEYKARGTADPTKGYASRRLW